MYASILFLFALFASSYLQGLDDDVPPCESHLTSMCKCELMHIIDCITDAPRPKLCRRFEECEKLEAQVVIDVLFEKCLNVTRGDCSSKPFFNDLNIPRKIFDCLKDNTRELNATEEAQMKAFEDCSREVGQECQQPTPPPPDPSVRRPRTCIGPTRNLKCNNIGSERMSP